MKTILAELNTVITSLEEKGLLKEASELNDVFMKFAQQQPKFENYIVKPGDSPFSIASTLKNNLQLDINDIRHIVDDIKSLNGNLGADWERSPLQPGQMLRLPTRAYYNLPPLQTRKAPNVNKGALQMALNRYTMQLNDVNEALTDEIAKLNNPTLSNKSKNDLMKMKQALELKMRQIKNKLQSMK